jgi:hypothetical protein
MIKGDRDQGPKYVPGNLHIWHSEVGVFPGNHTKPSALREQALAEVLPAPQGKIVIARAIWVRSSDRSGSWREIIGYKVEVRDKVVNDHPIEKALHALAMGLRASRAL